MLAHPEAAARHILRVALEALGAEVIEAETLVEARNALNIATYGVVLARDFPDGDGMSLIDDVERECPLARVIVWSDRYADTPPTAIHRLAPTDMAAVADALALPLPTSQSDRMVIDLERESLIDRPTGLLNRRALQQDVRREVARASRYGTRFVLVATTLAGASAPNLTLVATMLRRTVRASDLVYRTGAQDFAVILPHADPAHAHIVAERLDTSVSEELRWATASFPQDGSEGARLVELATSRLSERTAGNGPAS